MLHGEIDPLMDYLYQGYHQMRVREHDAHKYTSRPHFGIFVMPLGLTNRLVTSNSRMQVWSYLFLLHRKAWDVHQRQ